MPLLNRALDLLVKVGRFLLRGTRFQRYQWVNSLYAFYIRLRVRSNSKGVETVIVSFRSLEIEIESHDITILPTLISGEYESLELDAFERIIDGFTTFIDIGANVGIYSAIALQRNPRIRVIAFEPSEKAAQLFRCNMERNHLLQSRDVLLLNSAVSNFTGPVTWVRTEFQGTSRLGRDQVEEGQDGLVNSMTLDSLLEQTPDLRGPVFVKVDVEGFEPEVLAGATKFIRELRPVMQLEIFRSDESEKSWSSMADLLAENYRVMEIFGPRGLNFTSQDVKEQIHRLSSDPRLHNIVVWPQSAGQV